MNTPMHMLGLDDRALASSDDLLRHCPSFGTGKLAKSEGVLLAQLLEKQGYGIEPDVRFGGSAIAPGTHVVVFRLSKGAPTVASPQYASATILLHLAVAVANADGSISDSEEVTLAQHLRGRLGLTDGEVLRLMSHMGLTVHDQRAVDGILVGPETTDQRFVDDDQRATLIDVVLLYASPAQHGNSQRLEETGGHPVHGYMQRVYGTGRPLSGQRDLGSLSPHRRGDP